MSIAVAQLKYIFGLRSGVANNIAYHAEQTIVYPSGAYCVLYNMDNKTQKFISASEKSEGMTAMAVSPNRRYVAIAEKGEKATIIVYDLHSLRKRKNLTSPDVNCTEFVSIAFSPDSKYLISQGGGPDWTLLYWTWEKSKVMASIKTTNPQSNAPVYQVSFNPQDNTQLCVVGQSIFKLFRYSEGNLKQFGFSKMDAHNCLCHAWLSDERLIVGTDNGRLLLFDGTGELKHEFNLLLAKEKERAAALAAGQAITEADTGTEMSIAKVTAISAYSKGFCCSCGPGVAYLFEKTDDKEFYRKSREFKIPQDMNSSDPTRSEKQFITAMTISPSEELLVCSTNASQLYSITLSSADLSKGDQAHFEVLSHAFHSSSVTGLDVCIRKPLIATCSLDRSVRVWNYETCTLELYKEFAEEAYSIALHPSGLYVVVGFSDKLRLMNLLIDDIKPFKEFTIRGCRECSFSNGGHLFAAVHGNIIQVYSTMTFENVSSLKGHNGKVRSVIWSADDSKIVSCGMDGAIYEWETMTGKRMGENVLKSCSYNGVTISHDGKTIYAVGSDKTVKEVTDSQIVRDVEVGDTTLTSVVLSHLTGKMLFGGTASGALRSFKFPLTSQSEWTDSQAHASAISKMKMSFDNQQLITIGEDSSVLVWKIQDKEGRAGIRKEAEVSYAEEILITKSDLEDKNREMGELKTRVEELRMENEYQLRLKDMSYNEKIKELTEKFIQEMESLKTKNQVLKTEKDKAEAKHEEDFSELLEKHSKEMQDLESNNNQKLMLEYEKYQELQLKSQKMQEDYERQLQEMEESRERALEELQEQYEAKIRELRSQLDTSHQENRTQTREYDETKRQFEEDNDREVLDMKIKYEKRLKEEREANAKLKGETGIMKKKFTSLQKEIDDLKEEIKTKLSEIAKLNNVIKNLEKDVQGLKKEIQERDETIQDKEKRIYDLKTKNQELEKFKFVLDYKIKELKKQIEPKELEIKENKETIQEMEAELERFHKNNTQLELNINEIKQKWKATEKELQKERQAVHDVEALVRRFKTDLHNCVGYIQDPKLLKEGIRALYKKHVQEDITETASVDADIQKEYARQREHLERTVASLSSKLVKDSEIHRADNIRIMQENVSLIKEINDLRRELKISRSQVHDLEAALGLHRKSNKAHATETLAQIMTTSKNALLERDLEEKAKVVELQQQEILRLRMQLEESDGGRPRSSTTRLPPMPIAAQ